MKLPYAGNVTPSGSIYQKSYLSDLAKSQLECPIPRSDVDFGMLKMIQMLRGTCAGEIMVFRDIHEARRWLAVPDDDLHE